MQQHLQSGGVVTGDAHTAKRALTIIMIISAVMVFGFGHAIRALGVFDEKKSADVASLISFFVCYAVMISAPWWPLGSLKARPHSVKWESTSLIWIMLTCIPHVTWELAWVLFHDKILAAKGKAWAAPWWTYIDGGDDRYLRLDGTVLAMETMAAILGIIGLFALVRYYRSKRKSVGAVHIFLLLMSFDFLLTSVYYLSEFLDGFANVQTTTDLIVKFMITNSYWLVMPWVVGLWAVRKLKTLHTEAALAALPAGTNS